VQTYSSTRSLCSIERSNTPTDQYPKDGNFERAHDCQNKQPSLAPVKSPVLCFRFRPGEDKCHPGPIISEQSPVLTRYRKRNTENIGIPPPSCGEPLGEATDSRSPISSISGPWRIPIWRNGGKKSGCEERKMGDFVRVARIPWGGGGYTCVRASVRASVRACVRARTV
jgi:hypothetical protein